MFMLNWDILHTFRRFNVSFVNWMRKYIKDYFSRLTVCNRAYRTSLFASVYISGACVFAPDNNNSKINVHNSFFPPRPLPDGPLKLHCQRNKQWNMSVLSLTPGIRYGMIISLIYCHRQPASAGPKRLSTVVFPPYKKYYKITLDRCQSQRLDRWRTPSTQRDSAASSNRNSKRRGYFFQLSLSMNYGAFACRRALLDRAAGTSTKPELTRWRATTTTEWTYNQHAKTAATAVFYSQPAFDVQLNHGKM